MSKTIIVGGGLAGLTAAYYLHKAGQSFTILEASDRVGGRVRTDRVEGCLLDRGFQVFLTAYPEAKAILDYSKLQLRAFDPGAILLHAGGKRSYLGDPLRQLSAVLPTVLNSTASLFDKVKMLRVRGLLTERSVEQIFESKEFETSTLLRASYGFSEQLIAEFLQPFYAGIFLEQELTTSRRMFDFVFKMFTEGEATVPSEGMEAIPQQLASHLSPDSIRVQSRVKSIDGSTVVLTDDSRLTADKVLVATEATSLASQLTDVKTDRRSTICLYFTAESKPFGRKSIALQGGDRGLVNNMTCITNVAPSYSDGKHLISVSLRADVKEVGDDTVQRVKSELAAHFPSASTWQYLRTYDIDYALPDQSHISNDGLLTVSNEVAIIGDHTMNGSINAAMKSGRLGAEWVMS